LWQFDGWSENGLGGIYFYNDGRAYTPWGSTRPDLGRPEVRAFIRDQIFMLADEYRIDGFRWDSVYHLIHTAQGRNDQGVDFLREINAELAAERPRLLRIAEDHAFEADMGFDVQWDVGHRWASSTSSPPATIRSATCASSPAPSSTGRLPAHRLHEAHATSARSTTTAAGPDHDPSEDPESIWARKRASSRRLVLATPDPMIFQGQEMFEPRPSTTTSPALGPHEFPRRHRPRLSF
jgi:1,4-alpha-glucan branching enzyme